jgi:hypothetical protein
LGHKDMTINFSSKESSIGLSQSLS